VGDRRGGFTLLEVIVSLSILALVAASISLAFRMTVRSMAQGEDAVHASVRQRARFATLERLFRDANPAPVPIGETSGPWFRGEADRVSFLSVSPIGQRRGGGFRVLGFREGRLPTGEAGLLVSERSPFSPDAVGGESKEGAQLVFPGATRVAFFYVSGFTADGTMETENAWDAGEQKRFPVAVGIEFTPEGESVRRRIVIPLPVGMNQLPDKRPPLDAGPIG
jgi:prepilin-type N-terminal cleavage/methylation domain-containing protein